MSIFDVDTINNEVLKGSTVRNVHISDVKDDFVELFPAENGNHINIEDLLYIKKYFGLKKFRIQSSVNDYNGGLVFDSSTDDLQGIEFDCSPFHKLIFRCSTGLKNTKFYSSNSNRNQLIFDCCSYLENINFDSSSMRFEGSIPKFINCKFKKCSVGVVDISLGANSKVDEINNILFEDYFKSHQYRSLHDMLIKCKSDWDMGWVRNTHYSWKKYCKEKLNEGIAVMHHDSEILIEKDKFNRVLDVFGLRDKQINAVRLGETFHVEKLKKSHYDPRRTWIFVSPLSQQSNFPCLQK